MTHTPARPIIAAIVHRRGDHVEELMAEVARRLSVQSIRVGGLLQHSQRFDADARCFIELENLAVGQRYVLTQNLGAESDACALDTAALAEASTAVRKAISDKVDLIIVNKFGKQEAAGAGLRAEIMQVAVAGIPLLTSVSERFVAHWREFAGEDAQELPMSVDEVTRWCSRAVLHQP